jgi:hypothetical protein
MAKTLPKRGAAANIFTWIGIDEAKKNRNARDCFIVCLCYVCIFYGGSGNGFQHKENC